MRTLAIDCATEACSIALFEGDVLLAAHHELIGRGHAERLVPLIANLPHKGEAARILVSLGPGSFTGVRIGIAAARALGLAWNAQVLGYPTLALIAAMAREDHPGPVTVCMEGGHGEWFVQDFGTDGLPIGNLASLKPDMAGRRPHQPVLAGNKASAMAALGAGQVVLDILPDARQLLDVPSSLLSVDLSPIYGRAPDARLPQVR